MPRIWTPNEIKALESLFSGRLRTMLDTKEYYQVEYTLVGKNAWCNGGILNTLESAYIRLEELSKDSAGAPCFDNVEWRIVKVTTVTEKIPIFTTNLTNSTK